MPVARASARPGCARATCIALRCADLHVRARARRFEELDYADAASYMEDGRVVFTGSPQQMKARLRAMGAAVR